MHYVYEIGDIAPKNIGKLINVRGIVVRKSATIEERMALKLIEVNPLDLPNYITVKGGCDLLNLVSIGQDVVVTGVLNAENKIGKHISDFPYIECQEITNYDDNLFSRIQYLDDREQSDDNIFRDDHLDILQYKNSIDFIDYLQKKPIKWDLN